MASQPACTYDDYDDGAEASASVVDAHVLTSAEHGNVIYLTDDHHRRVAAVVPLDVANAGMGAVRSLEDARDLAIVREREHEAAIPWDQIVAEFAELDAQGR